MRALLAVLVLLIAAPAQAADVTIKWATLAPEGTVWYRALRDIGDEWSKISDGKVEVKIYAGGVVGNETAMVKKMSIGQLHGGQITSLGLKVFDKGPQVVQTPLAIQSYDELDYVVGKLKPEFESRLSAKGINVLNWGDAGWVYLFTKKPIKSVAEAKNFTIYVYDGEPAAEKMFASFGFKTKVMGATDVLASLQAGSIDAFASTRLGALSLQWFALAKNMLAIPWTPLMGATVITDDAWNQIPEEYHAEFKAAADRIGSTMKAQIRAQDEKAVPVMQKYGLSVTEVDQVTQDEWKAKGKAVWPTVRNEVMKGDEALFDKMVEAVEEYRKSK